MVIKLDTYRNRLWKISMPDRHTVSTGPYEGKRKPGNVWEDNEGLHIVIKSRSEADAMVEGVDAIMLSQGIKTKE